LHPVRTLHPGEGYLARQGPAPVVMTCQAKLLRISGDQAARSIASMFFSETLLTAGLTARTANGGARFALFGACKPHQRISYARSLGLSAARPVGGPRSPRLLRRRA